MVQRTKKQIVFDHIHIAHLALELIKAKVQYDDISEEHNEEYSKECNEENERRIESVTTQVRNIRMGLDKLIVEM